MTDILLLLIGAMLVNNLALTQLLGVGPLIHASDKPAAAVAMAVATMFMLTLSSVCNWLAFRYLLLPFDLPWLRTLVYMLIIIVVMKITQAALHKQAPLLHRALGSGLPLITVNCAALGVALINDNKANTLVESALYGFGAAAGFSLVLILFCALRERLAFADVPEPFQGSAIALITAGLMSLALMGFAALV